MFVRLVLLTVTIDEIKNVRDVNISSLEEGGVFYVKPIMSEISL